MSDLPPPIFAGTSPSVQEMFLQAVQYHQAGRFHEAERLYRQILQGNPRHADSLHLLGVLALQAGRADIAADLIAKAIAEDGDVSSFHCSFGNALQDLGKLAEAEHSYGRALARKPDYTEAHFSLGIVLQAQDKLTAAAAAYGQALIHAPDYAEAHGNLGNVFQEQGKLDEALAAYGRALDHKPDFVEAHYNRGRAFQEQHKRAEAVASYTQALSYKPDLAEAYCNLGSIFREQGKLTAAVAAYEQALIHKPTLVEAHSSLGNALQEQGKLDAAAASYGRALASKPDDAEAHNGLGMLYLLTGRFDAGWSEFEWRWGTKRLRGHWRDFAVPRWNGEHLDGRTILLHGEQGLGDTIQFCRYVTMVAGRGGHVVLEVDRSLVRLLSDLPGIAQIVAKDDPLPPFDLQCPLMSLPQVFGTRLESIPVMPNLSADPERVAAWSKRLPSSGRRIGIVWQGNPTYANDRNRSIPPACLAPLRDLPALHLVSLQKHGPVAPFPLIDVMDEIDDFADTAALIANLDLVIAVDTAVAHLAGALGKPVWLLNRFDSCWRWMEQRPDSPWYPSMRIFRQPSPDDWARVIADVIAAVVGMPALSGGTE